MLVVRVLGVAWLRAMALAQLGGLALLVLAAAIESVGTGQLLERLWHQVPATWAILAAPLAVVGSALAMHRLREEGVLLALGALGLRRVNVVITALIGGIALGAAAQWVGRATAMQTTIVRVPGGWFAGGFAVADDGSLLPGVVPDDPAWPTFWLFVTASSALGSVSAGVGGPLVWSALLLVGDLTRRSMGITALWPGLALLALGVFAAFKAHSGHGWRRGDA